MAGNKDLLIQDGLLEKEMYEQIFLLRRSMKAIEKIILEVNNEKNITDDSNTVNRM